MTGNQNPHGTNHSKHSLPEKVSFAVSLLILLGVVGAVLYVWIFPSQRPAVFHIEKGGVRIEGGSYYLDITVKNFGDGTAKDVKVAGALITGGKEEKVSTIFDYIPGRSEEKGVLIFRSDPSTVSLRVESYQEPS